MCDLALMEGVSGEIALYDIDRDAAVINQRIGAHINADSRCASKWNYTVADTLEQALTGADFVILSILPATFDEMASDVHAPEKHGILQPVGDTVGPGGVLRAMRTVPIYEGFARAIKQFCPNAWVMNFTNPMTICTKTLYDVFPEVKAFGCCHEVFHAQDFLGCVAHEVLGVPRPHRHDIYTDAAGVNHFTWITEASYQGVDLLKLIPAFAEKYFDVGYCERPGFAPDAFKNNVFFYGNKVKMDLYRRYGALGAAGDRHLVEFLPNTMYLKDRQMVSDWLFSLTTVDYRKRDQKEKIARSLRLADGVEHLDLVHSDEEACEIIKAILGFGKIVSNCNMPNVGQMPDMPLGAIVETNCVFDSDSVKPVVANRLPLAAGALVSRNLLNIEACYDGIKHRNLDEIFAAFLNQPLCSNLTIDDGRKLFREMISGTRKYLEEYYNLDGWTLN
jgi:alpha-galactosidase